MVVNDPQKINKKFSNPKSKQNEVWLFDFLRNSGLPYFREEGWVQDEDGFAKFDYSLDCHIQTKMGNWFRKYPLSKLECKTFGSGCYPKHCYIHEVKVNYPSHTDRTNLAMFQMQDRYEKIRAHFQPLMPKEEKLPPFMGFWYAIRFTGDRTVALWDLNATLPHRPEMRKWYDYDAGCPREELVRYLPKDQATLFHY